MASYIDHNQIIRGGKIRKTTFFFAVNKSISRNID